MVSIWPMVYVVYPSLRVSSLSRIKEYPQGVECWVYERYICIGVGGSNRCHIIFDNDQCDPLRLYILCSYEYMSTLTLILSIYSRFKILIWFIYIYMNLFSY